VWPPVNAFSGSRGRDAGSSPGQRCP